jgi:hypothetical protein
MLAERRLIDCEIVVERQEHGRTDAIRDIGTHGPLCSRHCAFGIVSAQAGIRTAVGATFTFCRAGPRRWFLPWIPVDPRSMDQI